LWPQANSKGLAEESFLQRLSQRRYTKMAIARMLSPFFVLDRSPKSFLETRQAAVMQEY
jgi:hypothetical protein